MAQLMFRTLCLRFPVPSCCVRSFSLQKLPSGGCLADRFTSLLSSNHGNFGVTKPICSTSTLPYKKTSLPASESSKLEDKEVLLFDSSGILMRKMTLSEAKEIARKDNMKLLDMDVNQDKMSCYKMISGKDYFEEKLKSQTQKKVKKGGEEKEFRMKPNIMDNDLNIKLNQIRNVLKKGKNVKISIMGDKRMTENEVDKLQSTLLKKVTESLQDDATVKKALKTSSGLNILLSPISTPDPGSQR